MTILTETTLNGLEWKWKQKRIHKDFPTTWDEGLVSCCYPVCARSNHKTSPKTSNKSLVSYGIVCASDPTTWDEGFVSCYSCLSVPSYLANDAHPNFTIGLSWDREFLTLPIKEFPTLKSSPHTHTLPSSPPPREKKKRKYNVKNTNSWYPLHK